MRVAVVIVWRGSSSATGARGERDVGVDPEIGRVGAHARDPQRLDHVDRDRPHLHVTAVLWDAARREHRALHAVVHDCERGVDDAAVRDHYDDGGVSGGTLDRPALKRLLADVEAGKIDVVVVYKIDRLSRSMLDFLKLVETFERHGVTFVSITQAFNTTSSMGRLTLNMLLSFAQFEREVIGERIRDKVAASRKKGIWMGGWSPLGYEVKDRKLVIHKADAERVRNIFKRFVELKSATLLAKELVAARAVNRYGHLLDKGVLYRLLSNRVYIGEAVHKGVSYPGEHTPIIDRKLWDQVHSILRENPRKRAGTTRAQTPALLKGLLFGPDGAAMSPTHTRKAGRLYRYYISQSVIKRGTEACTVKQIPAAEIERIVIEQIRSLLQTPEVIIQTWRAARKTDKNLAESDVRNALLEFEPIWNELFPAEQARLVELLVERVDLRSDCIDLCLRVEGLTSLCSELRSAAGSHQEAA